MEEKISIIIEVELATREKGQDTQNQTHKNRRNVAKQPCTTENDVTFNRREIPANY